MVILFGLNSGVALAAAVRVLLKMPVVPSLIVLTNRMRNHFAD